MAAKKAKLQSNKSLLPEQNENARAFLREFVDQYFDGNATRAAKAIGVSQGMVSELLSGKKGAGMKILSAVSAHSGASVVDILGGVASTVAPVRTFDPFSADPKSLAMSLFVQEERRRFDRDDPEQSVHEERLREFVAEFNERPFKGAENDSGWWLREIQNSFREWRAMKRGKAASPFGIGARRVT